MALESAPLAIHDTPDAGSPAAFDDPLYASGWTSAAIAIHSLRVLGVPMVVRLSAVGMRPIVIDLRRDVFFSPVPVTDLPTHPERLEVETEAIAVDAPSPVLSATRLDHLIWVIGHRAFGGHPASWLVPGERYRLRRWPDITAQDVAIDDVRMIATLAHTPATPAELAQFVGGDVRRAVSLINTLSLMGALRTDREVPLRAVSPSRSGLLARLRARMGR